MKLLLVVFLLAALESTGVSQTWPFQQHPAKLFHGQPASPKLRSRIARGHPTIIRKAVALGVNFAGHYRVVDWGCGSSCGVYVIVDERTGDVFDPPEIARGVDLGVAGPEFRPDSTLMVVASCPEPTVYGLKGCNRTFYDWDGSRLRALKTEPVTGRTE